MLFFEIIDNPRDLAKYIVESSAMEGKEPLIVADVREIVEKISDKGKEWYKIVYKGKRNGIVRYLSILKIDCLKDYLLHINMPSSNTISDLQAIVLEICECKNCMKNVPALRCTTDSTLADDEVEITIVVPVFDLGWQLDNMWKK